MFPNSTGKANENERTTTQTNQTKPTETKRRENRQKITIAQNPIKTALIFQSILVIVYNNT